MKPWWRKPWQRKDWLGFYSAILERPLRLIGSETDTVALSLHSPEVESTLVLLTSQWTKA